MKPDYALSLSLDGIKFLCRVDEGWHQLGDVPLEHADLDSALANLRKMGEDRAGGNALCKIILPNDQIKYLTLSDVDGDQDPAIAAALETATPYRLDEIVYDFVETADGVQVAAVAKDTLNEALEFASEHGFHPISFAAIPDADDFDAEPFFGQTPLASALLGDADPVGPDDTPIFVVSEGPLPADATSDSTDEAPEPVPAPAFASSRLVAPPQTAESSAHTGEKPSAQLGGAQRNNTDILTGPNVTSPDLFSDARPPESTLSAQEPRFDPATLIAGLKNRPEPSGDPRPRGAARASEPATAVAPIAAQTAQKPPQDNLGQELKSIQTEPKVGGKPRYLGAILVLILLAFMAGVALWASMFTEDGISGLFAPNDPADIIPIESGPSDTLETAILAPEPNADITDSAEIEALDANEGVLIDPVLDAAIPVPTGEALYAATGIWDRAPLQPSSPGTESADAIYLASFETEQQTHDAIALPSPESFGVDAPIARQFDPVAAGTTFDFDENGLVVATVEGAITPEGMLVFLGKPSALPASFPDRSVVEEDVQENIVPAEFARLAQFRPKIRPTDLIEQNERATLGGSTRSEIAAIRPKLRPDRPAPVETEAPAVQVVSIDPDAIAAATDQAVLASIRPKSRPENFATTIERQQERTAAVAVPRAERTTPNIPTTASVARNATQENAINLRKVNLIGVYGGTSDRT